MATKALEIPNCPLSSHGDTITLVNEQGLKVDGVSYSSGQAKPEGRSIVEETTGHTHDRSAFRTGEEDMMRVDLLDDMQLGGNRSKSVVRSGMAVFRNPPSIEDHPDLTTNLSNLEHRLESQYQHTGKVEDLEEAIQLSRRAIQGTREDDPNFTTYLGNLGVTLFRRYQYIQKVEDLEEAIELSRRAVQGTPEDHPNFTTYLSNLGHMLRSQYQHTGKVEILEGANPGV
ncbi:hypothetical protein CNMCM5623_009016 [Aspergillus felis]|uniref:Tetratricopeptide repeat domain protein n=1 Tax=Aspergillus felis TaxID=1287682 RepID=A0A8H6UUB4_9EURO|nr:hypothetical protein CNMCM5623_009016 [Aspergillus felis]